MRKSIALILLLASGGGVYASDLEMSAAEIRARVIGNTIMGIEDGKYYAEYLSPSGAIYGRNASESYRGYWRIVDNRLCLGYEPDDERASAGKLSWTCSNVGIRGNKIVWNERNDVSFSTLVPGRAENAAMASQSGFMR